MRRVNDGCTLLTISVALSWSTAAPTFFFHSFPKSLGSFHHIARRKCVCVCVCVCVCEQLVSTHAHRHTQSSNSLTLRVFVCACSKCMHEKPKRESCFCSYCRYFISGSISVRPLSLLVPTYISLQIQGYEVGEGKRVHVCISLFLCLCVRVCEWFVRAVWSSLIWSDQDEGVADSFCASKGRRVQGVTNWPKLDPRMTLSLPSILPSFPPFSSLPPSPPLVRR